RAGALASGSGRSIAGVDLGSAVRLAYDAGLIEKGGGHAMAAGLTVAVSNLGDLRALLDDKLRDAVSAASGNALVIDGALSAGGASLDLIELLDQAGPYGSGNPAP